MKENMIELNGHHHDGTLPGAIVSIACALIAILPTIFELGEKFDKAFLPFLHLLQGGAATIAILVGAFTILEKCGNWWKEKKTKNINKTFK